MKVVASHHIDCNDPDENGMYDYYYEYDIYEFIEGNVSYAACAYAHEPDSAHFINMKKESDKEWRKIRKQDTDTPLFKKAVTYLKNTGKSKIQCFMKVGHWWQIRQYDYVDI